MLRKGVELRCTGSLLGGKCRMIGYKGMLGKLRGYLGIRGEKDTAGCWETAWKLRDQRRGGRSIRHA